MLINHDTIKFRKNVQTQTFFFILRFTNFFQTAQRYSNRDRPYSRQKSSRKNLYQEPLPSGGYKKKHTKKCLKNQKEHQQIHYLEKMQNGPIEIFFAKYDQHNNEQY